MYLPDTNAWIAYLNPGKSPVKYNFRSQRPADIVFCSVVKAELLFGAYRSGRREANLKLLSILFEQFPSLPFDDSAAEVYGRIRADLAARGHTCWPERSDDCGNRPDTRSDSRHAQHSGVQPHQWFAA